MTVRYTHVDSPLGPLLLTRDEVGITGCYLPSGKHEQRVDDSWTRDDAAFDDARTQLAEYFAGDPAHVRAALARGRHAVPAAGVERSTRRSPTARRAATARPRPRSAPRARRGRWAWRTGRTRSRSSCRATGSWGQTDR